MAGPQKLKLSNADIANSILLCADFPLLLCVNLLVISERLLDDSIHKSVIGSCSAWLDDTNGALASLRAAGCSV